MGRASDVLAAGSADNRAVPKTPASWLLSADQSQTDAPLPGGPAPQSEPHNEPAHRAPRPSSPTPADCGQRPSADGVLLRRNRTIRPPQSVRDFLSGASIGPLLVGDIIPEHVPQQLLAQRIPDQFHGVVEGVDPISAGGKQAALSPRASLSRRDEV